MKDRLEKNLKDNFVFMEEIDVFTGEKLGYPKSCECGDGWYHIIRDLCEELNSLYLEKGIHPKEITVIQVKEKFGGLRFYTNGLIEGGNDIVSKYEGLSYETCEICGKKGKPTGKAWIQTLCEDCRRDYAFSTEQ